ncbi:NAD-dependent epimerase/dehydratase family protein [Paenibacillaceae bacterium WGS1546]|uniref:NAD-dependent epimerase/dehydratase family protein n=1 Tax=Cohnella sp. WGS1546 TaxID=3366810 RepID=UPI00372D58B8
MKLMRAIVTGGAGFIGSWLVRALTERGHEAIVIDDLSAGDPGNMPSGIEWHRVRVETEETAELIARISPRVVFHLAAQVGVGSSMKSPLGDAEVNILGTLRVLEGCRKAGSKLVFSSTSGVYGEAVGAGALREDSPIRPLAPYGLSKWAAEQYIRHAGIWWGQSYTILRYANVYGLGQTARGEGGVVACFLERAAGRLPLIIHGDGEQSRDFVHVDDVVRANLAAIDRGDGETLNIGTGIATPINELANLFERLGAAGGGRIREPARAGDARCSRLSARAAKKALGWEHEIDLQAGLARLVAELPPGGAADG